MTSEQSSAKGSESEAKSAALQREQALLDRTKHALFSHMRHELRTPVNAIIGYSELLLEEAEDRGVGGFVSDLEKIRLGGRHLLELVNEILDASKTDADKIDWETFGVELRLHLRTPLNDVIGYTDLLLEEAEEVDAADVIDDLKKIRLAGDRMLAMTEDLVNLVRIAAGKMDLDLGSSDKSAMIQELVATIRPVEEKEVVAPEGERGFLLVVDDNEMNRDMLSRRLQRQGHKVAVAENGRHALEMMQAQKFDLILLDMMMPEMNGYQVLEHLRKDETLRGIPVIMISAMDEIDSVVRCIEMGAEDYLTKPFNPVLLRARIGACLEKKFLRDREVSYLRQIEEEKKRADDLLHVIFPAPIVQELKATDEVAPRRHENVAVLFTDLVGFTAYCENREPEEIVDRLQQLTVEFEEIALRQSLQKIKTIGDAFMATAGLLEPLENPVLNCVRCGLEMVEATKRTSAQWQVRVGIHVGPVVAGVVGHRQYLYDLWGDTVNTASRMESNGRPGAVTLSREAWQRVWHLYRGSSLGSVAVKGKGLLEIFIIEGPIPANFPERPEG
ncbi:MAG TPA: adenylate/guanylate cyclase domain-containing protein [Acidobacteriota bacterium]|jgi:class 3 adenylate cyclase|nr:adenylate/guanylate cyclase domain-containing protein [Acidobacteriota bacterium]